MIETSGYSNGLAAATREKIDAELVAMASKEGDGSVEVLRREMREERRKKGCSPRYNFLC